MKLKTLKDLKLFYQCGDLDKKKERELFDIHGKEIVGYDELRQEAIKWIKEFKIERTDAISEMFDNRDKYGIYPTTKFFNRIDNFWMKKFNLTEGDLK